MKMRASIGLSVGLVFASSALADFDRQIQDGLSKNIARVRVVNETRRLANGSGVAVGPDKLITSCHGTRNARWIDVLGSERDWKVKRLVKDVEHDLCLLEVEGEVFEPFALAERGTELQIGDYVAAVGFAGPSPVIAEGTVKALHLHDDAKVIQTDAVFKAGESGGALLNREGKLVGILTFFVDAEGGSFFAVPTRWVEKLVQLADGGRAPESQPDLAFWERPDIERPMFLRALAREYGADWEGLKLIATQWVEQEAQNPEAWIALGKAHHHFKEGNGAVKAFREAIRIDPRHVEGWYSLGRAYSASNEDEGLEDALKNLEALSPTTAKALRDATRPSR